MFHRTCHIKVSQFFFYYLTKCHSWYFIIKWRCHKTCDTTSFATGFQQVTQDVTCLSHTEMRHSNRPWFGISPAKVSVMAGESARLPCLIHQLGERSVGLFWCVRVPICYRRHTYSVYKLVVYLLNGFSMS